MKQMEKIFGINIANFPKEEIAIGENSTAVKWGNGHGKSYIAVQVVVNLSPKLKYDFKNLQSVSNPETRFLANLQLSANQEPFNNDKERQDNMDIRLGELYNINETYNLSSCTGIYIVDKENDFYSVHITYPKSSNGLVLNRIHLELKDKDSYKKIYKYLQEELLIRKNTIVQTIKDIETSTLYDEIKSLKKEDSNMQESKSVYLNEKSPFYLGYKSKTEIGNAIVIAVNQKNGSIVEQSLINTIIDAEYYHNTTNDVKKIFKTQNMINILEEYKESKKTDIDYLSTLSNNISNLSNFNITEEFNKMTTMQSILESKLEHRKNNFFKDKEILINQKETIESDQKDKNDLIKLKKEDILKLNNKKEIINNIILQKDKIELKYSRLLKKHPDLEEITLEKKDLELKNKSEEFKNQESQDDYIKTLKSKLASITRNNLQDTDTISKNKNEILKNKDIITNILNKEDTFFDADIPVFMKLHLIRNNHINKAISKYDINQIDEAKELFKKMENLSENNVLLQIHEKELESYNKEVKKRETANVDDLNKVIIKLTKENDILEEQIQENAQIHLNKKEELSKLESNKDSFEKEKLKLETSLREINELKEIITIVSSKYDEINLLKDESHNTDIDYTNIEIGHDSDLIDSINDDIKNIEKEQANISEQIIKMDEKSQTILSEIKKLEEEYNYKNNNQKMILELIEENKDVDDITIDESVMIEKNVFELGDDIYDVYNKIQKHIMIFSNFLKETSQNKEKINSKEVDDIALNMSYNSIKNYSELDDLKKVIEGIISTHSAKKQTNINDLYEELKEFENSLLDLDESLKKRIKKEINILTKVKTKSGHQLKASNTIVINDYKESLYFNFIKTTFKADTFCQINQEDIEDNFDLLESEELIEFIDILKKFQKDEKSSSYKEAFDSFVKYKTKEFSLSTGEVSTGNGALLNATLRDLSLRKNKFFGMLLFLDEFGNLDTENTEIVMKSDINNKIILSNEGFEGSRNYLDVINLTVDCISQPIKGRKLIYNKPTWKGQD